MTVYRLWEGAAPGALGSDDSDIPTITDVGAPGGAPKPACIVFPGGGYGGLAPYEGAPVAEWMERIGVRGFVLKYRLGLKYHHPVMLQDAERAVRFVRSKALDLGVDRKRVGVLGFSAGGHLASTVSTHNSPEDPTKSDSVELHSSRPDFSVLLYPVITMKMPFTHQGSRENLLGKNPSETLVEQLSNELAVSLNTPQTFICHGADDQVVPIQNSLQYATALADHRVPFELYIPGHAPHGFAMGEPGSERDWTGMCEEWLKSRKII